MTPKFNIGIIGGGMYGKNVLTRWFQADPRAEVAWMCNRSIETAKQAAGEMGVARYTADYHDILSDRGIQAVVIAAPPYLHKEMLLDALAAGKHVFLEKPMAASRADVDAMVDAAEAHPELTVLEASCRHTRFQPKFRFVKELIDSGKLGQVYHIDHIHLGRTTFVEYNNAGTWGANKALAGGGPFADWGVYDLSFHLGLLGDRPKLKSTRGFMRSGLHDISRLAPVADVEQHGAAWMEFDTGLTYYYERGAGVHGESACETRIYGTQGGLRLEFPTWYSNEIEFYYEIDGDPRHETLTVDMSAHPEDDAIPVIGHFLDCLEGKAQPLMPIQLAAKHMRILFTLMESPAS